MGTVKPCARVFRGYLEKRKLSTSQQLVKRAWIRVPCSDRRISAEKSDARYRGAIDKDNRKKKKKRKKKRKHHRVTWNHLRRRRNLWHVDHLSITSAPAVSLVAFAKMQVLHSCQAPTRANRKSKIERRDFGFLHRHRFSRKYRLKQDHSTITFFIPTLWTILVPSIWRSLRLVSRNYCHYCSLPLSCSITSL